MMQDRLGWWCMSKVAAEVSKGKTIHRGDLEGILRRLEEVVGEVMEESRGDLEEEMSYSVPEGLGGEGKLEEFIGEWLRGRGR